MPSPNRDNAINLIGTSEVAQHAGYRAEHSKGGHNGDNGESGVTTSGDRIAVSLPWLANGDMELSADVADDPLSSFISPFEVACSTDGLQLIDGASVTDPPTMGNNASSATTAAFFPYLRDDGADHLPESLLLDDWSDYIWSSEDAL